MKTNVIGGVLFLIFGLVALFLIPAQVPAPEPGMIGPRYVPYIMAIAMILLSVVLIVQGLLSKDGKVSFRGILPSKEALLTTLLIILWVVGLALGLGFIPTSLLFVLAGLLLYRTKGWLNYAIAVVFVFVLYLVFAVFLRVQLP